MPAKRPPLSLKGRALALLAQREQSASELRRKLLRYAKTLDVASGPKAISASATASASNERHDPDPDADGDDSARRVDEIIDWLRAHNYLSEERFAESRVHDLHDGVEVGRIAGPQAHRAVDRGGRHQPASFARASGARA